jgi:predicted benzoate:H+ symporter BenE
MKKKYFMVEYLVEGLILTTAATDYIPHAIFLALLAGLMLAVYFKDGFQITTLYYIPMALGLIVGRHFEMKYTDTSICLAIVLMQYSENNVYELPQNKKIVGFRSSQSKDEEIY